MTMIPYQIAKGLCRLPELLQQLFEVLAGWEKISYEERGGYLLGELFSNRPVMRLYLVMALAGILLSIAFAMTRLLGRTLRERADAGSVGRALAGSVLRGILSIAGLSICVLTVFAILSLLLQQTRYLATGGDRPGNAQTVTFTGEQYAAMARSMSLIGNYSLGSSYDNPYNLSEAYNDLRPYLLFLKEEGVFDHSYPARDPEGKKLYCWQASLKKIASAADLSADLPLGEENEILRRALLETMEQLKSNASFAPLETLRVGGPPREIRLATAAFLAGTMHQRTDLQSEVSLTDPVRGPYLAGERSIFDRSELEEDFDLSIEAMDYLPIGLFALALVWELGSFCVLCGIRLLRIVALYLAAPVVFSSAELDGGARSRKWGAAFLLHSLSVLTVILLMRGILLLLPVLFASGPVLGGGGSADAVLKLAIAVLCFEAAKIPVRLLETRLPKFALVSGFYPEEVRKLAGLRTLFSWGEQAKHPRDPEDTGEKAGTDENDDPGRKKDTGEKDARGRKDDAGEKDNSGKSS